MTSVDRGEIIIEKSQKADQTVDDRAGKEFLTFLAGVTVFVIPSWLA